MDFLVKPKEIEYQPGTFALGKTAGVSTIFAEDRIPVLQLLDDLAAAGCKGRLTTDPRGSAILLRRDKMVMDPEGYRLKIGTDGITVSAGTPVGMYYGVQTLREIVRENGVELPCMEIHDAPDFRRRGYYLDCSRGKVPTVETVCELAERLAAWKMNELQLYVENVFTFAGHPAIGEGYSPFTPSDIVMMREHCRLHHVRFVPSLTSLGHFEKILMLDEYKDLGELPGFRNLPGGTTICPLDPRSLPLVKDLFDEFLPLFDADDVNACGDEPWELGQGRSKELADEVGVGRVYLDHILALRGIHLSHGKRMNIWGDIVLKHPEILPELPADIVLLNWDYNPNGSMMMRTSEFADAGLPLVCCPGTNGWQTHGTRIRQSMENIAQFASIALTHGAEGILNTDWGDGGHRNSLGASMHNAAYGAAHSWNTRGVEDGTFTSLFSKRFLGADLTTVIRTIGDDDYGYWAYHALLEKLSEPVGLGDGFCAARPVIEKVTLSDDALAAKIEMAESLTTPGAGRPLPRFESTVLEEYALANRMNAAAARRVLLARAIRGGKPADSRQVAAHRDELAGIKVDFVDLWLERNRVSRLDDNLAGFDAAQAELDTLG